MARSTYADLGLDKETFLPEADFTDSHYDGGLSARAPGKDGYHGPQAPTSALGLPTGGVGLLDTPEPRATPQIQSPVQPQAQPTATPPPTQPPTQPPAPFQPPASQPGTPPATTPGGIPPTLTESYLPKYSQLSAADQESLRHIVEDILGKQYGYSLGNWRVKIEEDPTYLKHLEGLLGPSAGGMITSILDKYTKTTPNPTYQSNQLDNQVFGSAVDRLAQQSSYGGRQSEEELLGELANRGLLNSGVAARELANFRAQKYQLFSEASSRLNEILFSNASEDIRQQAMARLQSELSLANQSALLRLKASLEQQAYDRQHQNDFLSFAGDLLGTGLGIAFPPAGAAYAGLKGVGALGGALGGGGGGGQFGVDDPHGFDVGSDFLGA